MYGLIRIFLRVALLFLGLLIIFNNRRLNRPKELTGSGAISHLGWFSLRSLIYTFSLILALTSNPVIPTIISENMADFINPGMPLPNAVG